MTNDSNDLEEYQMRTYYRKFQNLWTQMRDDMNTFTLGRVLLFIVRCGMVMSVGNGLYVWSIMKNVDLLGDALELEVVLAARDERLAYARHLSREDSIAALACSLTDALIVFKQ